MGDYEAKPCPRCGSEAIRYSKGPDGEPSYLSCTECDMEGPHRLDGLLKAIEAWNEMPRPGDKEVKTEAAEHLAKVRLLGRALENQADEIRRLKLDARASAHLADELSNRMDSIRAALPQVKHGEALVLDRHAVDLLFAALDTQVMVPWRSVGRLPEFMRVEEIGDGGKRNEE